MYYFRSRTKGYADGIVSGWVSTTAIARCTLANDIAEKAVKTAQLDDAAVTVEKIKASAVTANKINVENLASIQATLGDVTAGSIASHSKKENEKDVPDPDSSLLYLSGKNGKEEFYIGNIAKGTADESEDAHEFLWFKKTGGVASIIFKISNFIVTSVASIIKGVFKIRSKKNTDFIVVNPDETATDEGIAAKTMSVSGTVKATGGFTGNLTGNASTATKLATARTLNIQDADGSNTGTGASFNGSANATIKLPATIKATLTGNASTATKLATARTLNIQDASATNTGTGASFDGSGNATIKLPATIKANVTGNLTGNAATATKLATARTLNIQDADVSNTGTGAIFNGISNATIKLPATIKATLTGNASTATNAKNDGNGNNIASTYMPKSGGTFTGTIIPKAGTFDGATVSIGRDDGMVTIGNTTNSIGGWTTINNDCKMLGSLLINDHCHIRNYPAISGETSTDSAKNLVLNLYTN